MFLTKYCRSMVFLSKHFLRCIVLVLCIALVCGGISGCGNGDDVVTPTETVEVVDRYNGADIYFTIGDTISEGRVVEGVSANEVRVTLADGSERVVNVDHIGGTLIADHPDLNTRVVLLGDQDKGEFSLGGDITAVYDDGTRKIKLFMVRYTDGTLTDLDTERIRFVHKDADFEDGGYLTVEDYEKWLNQQ